MRPRVLLRMKNGQQLVVAGYASDVNKKVNDARSGDDLLPLERDAIPTGQTIFVDANEVASIVDDR